jgi:hypothetical protein
MTTLDELNKISIQNDNQALIVISNHLLTQNDRAMGDDADTCAYRGMTESIYDDDGYAIEYGNPTGLSCAVGCLIKDDQYDPWIEGNSVQSATIIRRLVMSHPDWQINGKTIVMLACLQRIHDRYKPKDWPYMLVALDTVMSLMNVEDESLLSNIATLNDDNELMIDFEIGPSSVSKLVEQSILKLRAESFDVMTGSSAASCEHIMHMRYNRFKDTLVYNEKGE